MFQVSPISTSNMNSSILTNFPPHGSCNYRPTGRPTGLASEWVTSGQAYLSIRPGRLILSEKERTLYSRGLLLLNEKRKSMALESSSSAGHLISDSHKWARLRKMELSWDPSEIQRRRSANEGRYYLVSFDSFLFEFWTWGRPTDRPTDWPVS